MIQLIAEAADVTGYNHDVNFHDNTPPPSVQASGTLTPLPSIDTSTRNHDVPGREIIEAATKIVNGQKVESYRDLANALDALGNSYISSSSINIYSR